MKYLILIHSNEASRQAWEGLSDEQKRNLGRGHQELRELLAESGELIVSEGLVDPAQAKRVRVRGGDTIATDGPFAEVKEHLAGFYLVECESMDRAVELAAKAPDAEWGEVEVRPVLDLRGVEF
ncbi:YciI family protein [Amycolatopsis sp. CA-230715]|uniref:YciI family protein n=1 Tax=Amycolatopsis sp. CA-230715 TaxID=2745196 RepID=UPI001C014AA3|nr:YciI family protein [Amycolatopsis sp. CA-230715]QWF82060.1 hypothetical protein HUW46_05497 [Amycolatopsis sp. CA-230715]